MQNVGHPIEKLVQFLKQVKGIRRTEERGSGCSRFKKNFGAIGRQRQGVEKLEYKQTDTSKEGVNDTMILWENGLIFQKYLQKTFKAK